MHNERSTLMPADVLGLPIHVSHNVWGLNMAEDAPRSCGNVIEPAWLWIRVEVVVAFVRPRPYAGARVVPLHPRGRRIEAILHPQRGALIHELKEQPRKLLRCARIAHELDPTRHVFLSSRGLAIADRSRARKRPWAWETVCPEMTLHFDASADSRGIWSHLDNDLALVGEPHADDNGKMSGDEQNLDGSRAEHLIAPLGQALLINRGCLQ